MRDLAVPAAVSRALLMCLSARATSQLRLAYYADLVHSMSASGDNATTADRVPACVAWLCCSMHHPAQTLHYLAKVLGIEQAAGGAVALADAQVLPLRMREAWLLVV